ncbi:MAG: HU family DNA-binding protein [Tannerella sp.]|jgi:nucleoid DNA-binding protein|nr:HU family DNA-binding protein [Tannerella sp.]
MKEVDFITELSVRLNWEKQDVESMLVSLGDLMGEKLSQYDTILLNGLGQFEARKKADRKSSINGKLYLIPPKLVAVFRPTGNLKNFIKTLDGNE